MSACLRRLHLDFHNPAGIPDLCADFDAREFAVTIRKAGFDSVTVFALDSHGHCYYPSHKGIRHPDLKIDFLGEVIEACHHEGLLVGAYFAVGSSDFAKQSWCQVDTQGHVRSHLEQGGYQMVCLNSPHIEQTILPVTAEVLDNYPVDCIWYDLLHFFDEGCHCQRCRALMKEWNLSWESARDVRELTRRTVGVFADKTARFIRRTHPAMQISYNTMSIHERPSGVEHAAYLDIEAPATGGWGYFYFPPRARYLRTLGVPVAGMTVAFHKSWGDFGGLKSKAQLEHESYTYIAGGAAVGIGDQLPPRGRLEKERYRRIGEVLNPIRDLEPFLRGAHPLAEAAIVLPPLGQGQFPSPEWSSATKMLLETKLQFDTVDREADWRCYPLLILPDEAYADAVFRKKLKAYLAAGGKVLATGNAVDALPAEMVRRAGKAFSPVAYLRAKTEIAGDITSLPHIVSSGFLPVKAKGARVLATLTRTYSKKGPRFFFSAQVPYAEDTAEGVLFQWRNLIYGSAPFFMEYWKTGYGVHRQLLKNCIQRLQPKSLLRTNAPLAWEIAILQQGTRRLCVIVPYCPLRNGQLRDQIDYWTPQIDDWTPMANLQIRVLGRYQKAYAPREKITFSIVPEGDYSLLTIPVVCGPMVVVIEAAKRSLRRAGNPNPAPRCAGKRRTRV
ncbi:MAG: alpha-L-fucosidase [Kiritimatiellae bacterium]|nr:alpha-L-fucosidase [Kiritimatiellia bacterium]